MCKNITIVVPTFERPKYILRLIKYYEKNNFVGKIIVLDGSFTRTLPENIAVTNLDLLYQHYPGKSFSERLCLSSKLVNTEYVVLSSDDELYSIKYLEQAELFLELNNDYAAYIGRVMRFFPLKYEDGSIQSIRLQSDKTGFKNHRCVEDDEPILRSLQHIANFEQTCSNSIMKTNIWRLIYINTPLNKCESGSKMHELEFLVSLAGKVRIANSVSWLRSSENEPIQTEAWTRKYSFSDWFSDSNIRIRQEREIWINTTIVKALIIKKTNVITNYLEMGFRQASKARAIRDNKALLWRCNYKYFPSNNVDWENKKAYYSSPMDYSWDEIEADHSVILTKENVEQLIIMLEHIKGWELKWQEYTAKD